MVKIKNFLKNNTGDMYFQMLICLMAVIVIVSFSFNVITVMSQKTWLDDKLNDITKIIAVQGAVCSSEHVPSTAIKDLEDEIINRMGGGEFTYTTDSWFDEETGRVQLNGVVKVNFKLDDYPAVTVANIDIPIDIDITKQGISEVYWKPSGS